MTYDPTYKINLASLPPPTIIEETLYQVIYKDMLEEFLGLAPDYGVLLESDPVVKLIQAFAYREFLLRKRVNAAARARLLAFATKADLDHVGAEYGVERLRIPATDTTDEIVESDERFLDRIQTKIIGASTAGAREHYRYWAMTADLRVEDANVDSPEDGSVRVSIMQDNDTGIPTEELIGIVRAMIMRDDVKVLTDTVTVGAAEAIVQPINAVVRLLPSTPAQLFDIISARFRQTVKDRVALGRDLTISWIMEQLHEAGVYDVTVLQPGASVIVSPNQFITPGAVTLTLGMPAE